MLRMAGKAGTMDNKLYNETAGAQLTAHDITRDGERTNLDFNPHLQVIF